MATNPAISSSAIDGRRRNDKRETILRAAEEEFELHGYGGARMQRIADRASLPKANIHYYYQNKLALYHAVLDNILSMWNSAFDDIKEEDDPAESIERYIRAKLEYSRKHARASRIFTSEIIHGAPHVKDRLQTMSKRWLEERSGIIHNWIKLGKLRPVDPFHLFFLIWSSTQYYADYEAEVSLIYGKPSLDKSDYDSIAMSITQLVLNGCGAKG